MLIGLIIVIAMQFVSKRASQNMCYALIEVTITFVCLFIFHVYR